MNSATSDDTADGYVLDDQVGYLLRLASQRHTAIFAERMLDGLTPTQFSVLVRLGDVGEASQNQLGRMVGLDVATAKGVIDRLVAKALVEGKPDPSDARRRTLTLTEAGRAILSELKRRGAAITEETLAPLDGEDRLMLLALLRRLAIT